jgi:hypothetical protein
MSHASRLAGFKLFTTVGSTHVWQLKGAPTHAAIFFESGLTLDADGAPKAYGPPSLAGTLDYLANAGHSGNWWGLVKDRNGHPIVQSGVAPQQPCRGFYISQTTLINYGYDETDVRRFADADRIPYIALPPDDFHGTGLKIGDLALLINANNGNHCFAIFADSKKKPNLGEVSIHASRLLGGPTDARHDSLPRGIIKLVFPGSGIGQGSIPDAHTIGVTGRMSLEHFSLHRDKNNTLLTAYPEFPKFATALTAAGY